MTKTRSLGKIFGVEIKVHGTFLLLLAFVAISGLLKGGTLQAIVSVALSAIIFSVVVLHEFGHILAARRYGIKTRDVILSPLGGMARLERLPSTPKQEIVVAAAGPVVNLVLAGIGGLVLPFISTQTVAGALMGALTGWFVTINLVLLGFNLIPALPMDGGRILRALLSKRQGHLKATQTAAKVARWSALLMATYAIFSGQLMLLLIAGFVFVMSWIEVFQAKLREAQTNPAFRVFQQMQANQGRASQGPNSAPYSGQVVDQYGHPVNPPSGSGGGWSVKNVRWVDGK
jgi:Zn-dependent protease